MKKIISILGLTLLFVFTGCSSKNSIAYDAENHKQIKQVLVGKILSIRDVYIKDEGAGKAIGAVVGGVLGSTVGKGDGSKLATLGGAVLGGVIGNEVNKTNAQELTVLLENAETIVVLSKDTNLRSGDRVRIISVGNEVSSVYKI